MVDFKKLMDPAYQAEAKLRREAESAAREAHDNKIREALDKLLERDVIEALSDTERRFVNSCNMNFRQFRPLTEKQLKWLFDLAERV